MIPPYAFGQESKSPIQAVWDAIYDLQNQNQKLQAQIDDLRAESGAVQQDDGPMSELSASVELESTPASGQVAITVKVKNDGPERAAGAKLTLFYKMSLFQLDSIHPDDCRNLERGIIQCDLGTMESGDEVPILVSATAIEDGVPTTIIADVSSTTEDRVPANNHVVFDFVTARIGADGENEQSEDLDATAGSDQQESKGQNSENGEKEQGNQTGSEGQSDETPPSSNNQTSSEPSSEEEDDASTTGSEADEEESTDNAGEDQQTSSESASSGDGEDDGSAEEGSQNETPSTGSNQTSSQNDGG